VQQPTPDRSGTLALAFGLSGLLLPIVVPIVAPMAIVYARRSGRELGYRSVRAIIALVLAWAVIVLLILAAGVYLIGIWIGHSNFG